MQSMDVVYTWVDGTRPDYWDLLATYSEEKRDLNPERFRDEYQILRYSMRSLRAYAPWLGKIYLFTARPHVPPWLDLEHPQIRVIHHDEVFDDARALPTFNCYSIETQLQHLPCSDPFLYFNDDYLLGAPCGLEQFRHPRRGIRVFGTLVGERLPWRIRHGGLSLGFSEHTPLWIDKALYQRSMNLFEEERQKTLFSRFRKDWNLRMERAYRYYLLAHTRDRCVVPFWQALREVTFHKIKNNLAEQQRLLARIVRLRPPLLCFNDDQRDHPNPEVVKLVQDWLRAYYPVPAPWER